MVRRWCLAGAMVLLCCSLLPARQGVVRTDDGRTIEGDVADDPNSDTVTVTVGNAQVAVDRSDILSIEYGDNVARQFKQRLAELPSTDIRSRLELGRWALDKKQYALARQAAREVMRIDPGTAGSRLPRPSRRVCTRARPVRRRRRRWGIFFPPIRLM